jgi:stage III sporulation protein AG
LNTFKTYFDNLRTFLKSQKGVKVSISLGLLGLILILVSDCTKSGETSQPVEVTTISTSEDYRITLESNLQELINSVSGAGDTKVMVTLSTGEQNLYAEDIKQHTNSDGSTQYESSYVTVSSNGEKSALVSATQTPQVMGVVVLCQGGSKGSVREDVYSIVSALTGLTTDRIFVGQLDG